MLDGNTVGQMFGIQQTVPKLLEHLGQAFVKI